MLRRSSISFLLAALAVPALALAADTAQHDAIATTKEGIASGITALVVFGFVFAVLAVKVWPAIASGLDERANKIKNEIEAAEAARAQAKSALKEIDKARTAANALSADLRAKAETDMAAMKAKALADIEAAKRVALAEIYVESANLATAVAGKILQREINRNDQSRLVEDALNELKTAGARA
jgi:F-type H+-transporting ATPase subunit b